MNSVSFSLTCSALNSSPMACHGTRLAATLVCPVTPWHGESQPQPQPVSIMWQFGPCPLQTGRKSPRAPRGHHGRKKCHKARPKTLALVMLKNGGHVGRCKLQLRAHMGDRTQVLEPAPSSVAPVVFMWNRWSL